MDLSNVPLRRPALWAGLLILLAGLLVDLHLTRKYGGADLRDKVIGSRSLLEGRSPYFEPWRPGDPERFADPMVPPGSELTRFTGSPFQALFMAPMAPVHFPTMRLLWTFLQYALLLLTVGLMYKAFGTSNKVHLITAFAVLAVIVSSGSWRLHVERGQIYVIYAVLIAGVFLAAHTRSHGTLGVLGAILVLSKPTYGLLLLPLVFHLTWRMLAGGAVTIMLALVPFLFLPDGFSSWAEYSEAMKIWGANPGKGAIPPPVAMDYTYPAVIEGASNLADHHTMEAENGSITTILLTFGVGIPDVAPYVLTLLLIGIVLLPWWKQWRQLPATDLILLGSCFNTILMMLLPVLRFHYQFVMWTAPILYVLLKIKEPRPEWTLGAIFAGLLVVGALELLPINVLLAEMILLVLIAHYFRGKIRSAGRVTAGSSSSVLEHTY